LDPQKYTTGKYSFLFRPRQTERLEQESGEDLRGDQDIGSDPSGQEVER
jgi:hypothetical protein